VNASSLPCYGCKKECLSEMLGTYLLVFIGPASVVAASLIPFFSSIEALVFVALAFGSTVAVIIVILGTHSGALINPAVTIASALAGMFKRELFVPYVVFQVIGGLLAGLSLKIVFGPLDSSTSLGATKLASGISPVEGLSLEIVGTFILAISALSASSFFFDSSIKQGILVGATLFTLILLIGPLTGAGFNPARSFGPSVFSGYFNNQIIYWIGPVIGAGLAGLIFSLVRRSYGRTEKKRFAVVCMCS
jgi:MIP family channel proteins